MNPPVSHTERGFGKASDFAVGWSNTCVGGNAFESHSLYIGGDPIKEIYLNQTPWSVHLAEHEAMKGQLKNLTEQLQMAQDAIQTLQEEIHFWRESFGIAKNLK